MDIHIEPLTQYNAFLSEPNGRYHVNTCVDHNSYHPVGNFEEKNISVIIEQMQQLLQYFKGEHTISVSNLIWCKPYEVKTYSPRASKVRNWKIISGEMVKVLVDNPKPAKVTASSGSSFGSKGWFLKVEFGIEGVRAYSFGIIFQSYKSAKEGWERQKGKNLEISHWVFEEIRKKRRVKCNSCGKSIENLTAQQCSECGRYFCDECMTADTCQDCQMKGEE
jgi:hypothetical protein